MSLRLVILESNQLFRYHAEFILSWILSVSHPFREAAIFQKTSINVKFYLMIQLDGWQLDYVSFLFLEASIICLCKQNCFLKLNRRISKVLKSTFIIKLKKSKLYFLPMSTQQLLTNNLPPLNINTTLNNFILRTLHRKQTYKQQAKKKASKTVKTNPHAFHLQYKQDNFCLLVKDDKKQAQYTFEPTFTITDLQKHVFSSITSKQRKRFVYNLYRGAIYSLLKLKQPSEEVIAPLSLYLSEPTVSQKKFLLLDLDETLIYAQRRELDGKTCYRFAYRPHLLSFLQRMNQLFEVYVFTAAQKGYAEAVVGKLNRRKTLIKDILHREHCLETKKGIFLKDLRIIKNRGLEDIVILDNLVESFGLQINNGIPIHQFQGSPNDCQLPNLIPLMQKLSSAKDVRVVLKEVFQLQNVTNLDREKAKQYFSSE